jgi:hypothetical protein
MSHCDRWGCCDERTNLKSGIIDESCRLRCASGFSLFLHLLFLSYWIAEMQLFSDISELLLGRYSSVGISSRYGLDDRWVRIPVTAIFSAPAQTGLGALFALCKMGTRSVPRIKRPGHGFSLPPLSSSEVKEESYTPTVYQDLINTQRNGPKRF